MVKRLSDSEIWKKDWFLDLTDKQKLLVKFLFDNCDCAGIYEISQRFLKASFEQPITKEDFKAIKQVRFINEKTIFIEDFIKFQYNVGLLELNPKFTVHKGILSRLNKYGIFETLSKPLVNPLLRVQDKDKDNNKDIDNTINKQIDTYINDKENLKNYGEYLNVTLTSEQYGTLLAMCASQKLLDQIINNFSESIEIGKEQPYKAELPNAHFLRLKQYYKYRQQNPDKFNENGERITYKTKDEAFIEAQERQRAAVRAAFAALEDKE